MTDSENQRQRHLAEMMIAECDGKQVQRKNVHNDTWFPFSIQRFLEDEHKIGELRIKPEPREWWICLKCFQQFTSNIGHHATNSNGGALCGCPAVPVHVIEVLND